MADETIPEEVAAGAEAPVIEKNYSLDSEPSPPPHGVDSSHSYLASVGSINLTISVCNSFERDQTGADCKRYAPFGIRAL